VGLTGVAAVNILPAPALYAFLKKKKKKKKNKTPHRRANASNGGASHGSGAKPAQRNRLFQKTSAVADELMDGRAYEEIRKRNNMEGRANISRKAGVHRE